MKERIIRWFEEFALILEFSPRTEWSVIATGVVPVAIQLLGLYVAAQLDLAPPFQGLGVVLREGFQLILSVIAIVVLVRFAAIAHGHYTAARKQLFG